MLMNHACDSCVLAQGFQLDGSIHAINILKPGLFTVNALLTYSNVPNIKNTFPNNLITFPHYEICPLICKSVMADRYLPFAKIDQF